jgi:hypothetical protein
MRNLALSFLQLCRRVAGLELGDSVEGLRESPEAEAPSTHFTRLRGDKVVKTTIRNQAGGGFDNMTATMEQHGARESALWRTYSQHRYAILFYSLLLMLVVMPVASTIGVLEREIKFLLAASLLAAVMPSATKRTRYLLPALILVLMIAQFGSDRGHVPFAPGLVAATVGLIGLLAAGAALRFMVSSSTVDHETIYAALSAYLLAGLFFGQIYYSINILRPDSLTGPDPFSEADAVYFSFVTLASLGYGDFLPRTDLTRGIAIFEVIGGQLFLVVMVARLVGLFVESKRSD